ncbi:MAG: very short patch repair endonuclease [Armatimonadota bacterium]|nr:MAG: very short patch repair endonuclease [Armatimonadota bacterium]
MSKQTACIDDKESYAYLELRDSNFVSEAVRRSMRGNRSKGTSPELRLRKFIWAAGVRGFRTNVRSLPGVPDIVFGKSRVAVFVHGCFWHSCPRCLGSRIPRTNSKYWSKKLSRNRERDAEATHELQLMGYRVHVVWECELRGDRLEETVHRIKDLVVSRRLKE